jgi:outer membrane protein assembly factor BamA
LASVEYNLDDGIFLGAGILYRKHGFRKEPFAMQHSITANYAIATSSYHLRYHGIFTDLIGKLDLDIDLDRKKPNYVSNFFGLGNETTYTLPEDGINYYRARFRQLVVKTLLKQQVSHFGSFYFGPTYQDIEVEQTPGRFISDLSLNRLDNSVFRKKYYAGAEARFIFDKKNNPVLPTEGIAFNLNASVNKGMNTISNDFGEISSSLAFYWTFRLPARLTLATRFGGGVSFGNYEFYQAQILSGNTNLRGFRKTRFAGGRNLYQNTELRIKLFSFRSYLFPAQVGILGFNDIGRVWQKGETSDTWHHGYGGGIWLAPLNRLVISFMYGFSKEDSLPLIKAGFMF